MKLQLLGTMSPTRDSYGKREEFEFRIHRTAAVD